VRLMRMMNSILLVQGILVKWLPPPPGCVCRRPRSVGAAGCRSPPARGPPARGSPGRGLWTTRPCSTTTTWRRWSASVSATRSAATRTPSPTRSSTTPSWTSVPPRTPREIVSAARSCGRCRRRRSLSLTRLRARGSVNWCRPPPPWAPRATATAPPPWAGGRATSPSTTASSPRRRRPSPGRCRRWTRCWPRWRRRQAARGPTATASRLPWPRGPARRPTWTARSSAPRRAPPVWVKSGSIVRYVHRLHMIAFIMSCAFYLI
jgi:hypothetical protein